VVGRTRITAKDQQKLNRQGIPPKCHRSRHANIDFALWICGEEANLPFTIHRAYRDRIRGYASTGNVCTIGEYVEVHRRLCRRVQTV
jgi:hypothetical protein